jgi:hypothetical protein
LILGTDLGSNRIASIEDRLNISFSNVKYREIAAFVGLEPNRISNDIEIFGLHRSRIPTGLFKLIVEDIDLMLVQYGPPIEHQNEEVRSRFLSPVSANHFSDHRPPTNSKFYSEIFNRLIAVYGFAYRNLPESTIKGRITIKGRVEYYFQTMGSIPVFFIEIKFKIGSGKERLDAIAQVIAECGGQASS